MAKKHIVMKLSLVNKNSLLIIIFSLFLLWACKKEEEEKKPTACFSYSSESYDLGEDIQIDEEISFSNCSENAVLYLWEFGDGSQSTSTNPTLSYDESGSYIVKLTAYGSDKSLEDFILKTIEVSAPTSLTFIVKKSTDLTVIPSAKIWLWESEDVYLTNENSHFGMTEASGKITFEEDIKPIIYWVVIQKLTDDETQIWDARGKLSNDALIKNEDNEFTILLDLYDMDTTKNSLSNKYLLLNQE